MMISLEPEPDYSEFADGSASKELRKSFGFWASPPVVKI
jgi:hypothetical protein